MTTTIDDIISSKIPCYFISPHLDDAILSAGGLLSYLSGKTSITLINVFTKPGHKPYTAAAKGFLRHCGFNNADELYKHRYAEDDAVCKKLGIRSIHLGFIDGSFRRRIKTSRVIKYLAKRIPEIEHSYPLGRKILRLAKDDQIMAVEIKQKLLEITKHEKVFIIFCPLGSVKHMDHVLTRDICMSTFQNVIFWNDYPYINKIKKKHLFLKKHSLTQFSWEKNIEDKKNLIKLYKSQLPSLFPDGIIQVRSETYSQFGASIKMFNKKPFFIRPFGYLGKLAFHFK